MLDAETLRTEGSGNPQKHLVHTLQNQLGYHQMYVHNEAYQNVFEPMVRIWISIHELEHCEVI